MTDPPIDELSQPEIPKTNYKKWSFRMLSYTLLCIITVFLLQANAFNIRFLLSYDSLTLSSILLFVLSIIFFISGIIFTILSHTNSEERNYQYHISVWGFLTLTIISVLFIYMIIVIFMTIK